MMHISSVSVCVRVLGTHTGELSCAKMTELIEMPFGEETYVLQKNLKKVKVGFFYGATYAAMPRPAALYNRRKWQLIGKSQWCWSIMLQLQHTPLPLPNKPHQATL